MTIAVRIGIRKTIRARMRKIIRARARRTFSMRRMVKARARRKRDARLILHSYECPIVLNISPAVRVLGFQNITVGPKFKTLRTRLPHFLNLGI